jgi:hypothetical protein
MEVLLIVLVLITVYFLAKYTYFKVDLSQNIEVFPSRGAPLVKRSMLQTTNKEQQQQVKVSQKSLQEKNNPSVVAEALQKSVSTEHAKVVPFKLPEDVVLRRHFLTQLKAEIAVRIGSKPTDSCLARHYEALVQTEISKALGQ